MAAIECRVINLDRRGDRLTDIGGRLDTAGIVWVRQPACDAAQFAADALISKVPGRSHAYPMTHVERACALSHLAAWQAFLAGDGLALCVLEDDIQFAGGLATLLADDAWLSNDHGLVKLDANSSKPRKSLVSNAKTDFDLTDHALWRLWSRRLGGGGYIANRRTIEALLGWHSRPNAPIDHCLFNPAYGPQFTRSGVHVVEPPLVFHDHAGSDMQVARKSLQKGPGWAKQKIARELVGLSAFPARAAAMLRHNARFRTFDP